MTESTRGGRANSKERVEVSVIVACRNVARYLPNQLAALAQQDCECSWELIIVDNGSSDGSREIAERFSERLNLRLIVASARQGPSYARNVGARWASADKLLFVDADDEVLPRYVAAMSASLDSHDFVTSRVDCRTLNRGWVGGAHGEPWQEETVGDFFGFLPAAAPCNFGISRRAFDAVGGFPEEYQAAEDIAFSWRVQLAGFRLAFVSGAELRYRYRDSLPGLFDQTRVWGSCLPLLYKEFRAAGMPARPLCTVALEWKEIAGSLRRARSKEDLAPVVVRLGYSLGRLVGSFRYRVTYV